MDSYILYLFRREGREIDRVGGWKRGKVGGRMGAREGGRVRERE